MKIRSLVLMFVTQLVLSFAISPVLSAAQDSSYLVPEEDAYTNHWQSAATWCFVGTLVGYYGPYMCQRIGDRLFTSEATKEADESEALEIHFSKAAPMIVNVDYPGWNSDDSKFKGTYLKTEIFTEPRGSQRVENGIVKVLIPVRRDTHGESNCNVYEYRAGDWKQTESSIRWGKSTLNDSTDGGYTIKGRGPTHLREVTHSVWANKDNPNLLIYRADGDNSEWKYKFIELTLTKDQFTRPLFEIDFGTENLDPISFFQ